MSVDGPGPISTEVHINESSLEYNQTLNDLYELFGTGAAIRIIDTPDRKSHKKEIIVELTLAEGISEGGQDLIIRLNESIDLPAINNHNEPIKLSGYFAESITVNGISRIFEEFSPVVFCTQQELRRISGTKQAHGSVEAYSTKQNIISGPLRTSDDLVSLMHEQGHEDDDNVDSSTYPIQENYLEDLDGIRQNPSGIVNQDIYEMIERWLHLISLENTANQNIFTKQIGGRRANDWANIFPSDSQNSYTRLSQFLLQVNYLPRFHAERDWFIQHMTDEQKARLPSLDYYPDQDYVHRNTTEVIELIEDIRMIFGESATVITGPENDSQIFVESSLQDGEYLRGGQKIQAIMQKPKKIEFQSPKGINSSYAFEVAQLIVNDIPDTFDDFPAIYLTTDRLSKSVTMLNNEEHTRAILSGSLDNIDDLLFIMHEAGHHDSMSIDDFANHSATSILAREDRERVALQVENIPDHDIPAMVDRWLELVNYECIANKELFQRLTSDKANNWRSIFSSDQTDQYYWVERTINSQNLNTYIMTNEGWFFIHMNGEQREQLTHMISSINPRIEGRMRYIPILDAWGNSWQREKLQWEE